MTIERFKKMEKKKSQIFTVPNLLSFVRLLLIPIFVWEYLHAETLRDYQLAALLVLLSGLTDLLDGWIARHFNLITELGKALDPIADKLTQAAVLICLMFRYRMMGVVAAILVVRDLFMGINGLILLRRGKKLDGAKWFGKVSTAVFYGATFLLILLPGISSAAANGLMLLVGFFLCLSFALYFPLFCKMYRESTTERAKVEK